MKAPHPRPPIDIHLPCTYDRLTVYTAVLFLHSWLRYAVLGLALYLLVACLRSQRAGAPWTAAHERVQVAFLAAVDTQLVLGLALYLGLSPVAKAALANFGAAMKDPQLRFFGVEHLATMLIAIVVAHVGRVRQKRMPAEARCKSASRTLLAFLVLTLLAIPWPGLDVGRPLFRF